MARQNDETTQDISNKISVGVASTTNDKNYFEELYPWRPQILASDIFADAVPFAADPTEADANVIANPTVIEKLTDYIMDELPASNGQGYGVFSSPGDTSSTLLKNFLLPQRFGPGYSFVLQQNDGTVIDLTEGAYQFDYANGIMRFDPDNRPIDFGYDVPMKLTAYRYIGQTMTGATTCGVLCAVQRSWFGI